MKAALLFVTFVLVVSDEDTCSSSSPGAFSNEILNAYAERHNALLSTQSLHMADARIVNFHARRTGLADRLLGLISAFILAFATDRTFLADFGSPINSMDLLFQSPGWDWNLKIADFVPGGTERKLDLSWKVFMNSDVGKLLLCKNLTKEFDAVNNLDVGSSEYWIPLLMNNPYHKDYLLSSLGNDMFRTVADFLLKPIPKLQAEVDKYNAKVPKRAKRLSMHVRVGHSEMDMIDEAGNIEGWYKPDVSTFIKCSKELALDYWKELQLPMSVFVATDNLPAQIKIQDALLEYNVTFISTEKNFTEDGRLISTDNSKTIDEGQYTVAAFESALIDYWLLGETDTIIVSTMSSVASFAPGRRSLAPIVATVDKQCIAVDSSMTEPCFHLLARNYRSAVAAEGDYDPTSVCDYNVEDRGHLKLFHLPIRRHSVYYHSERYEYTCLAYNVPMLQMKH